MLPGTGIDFQGLLFSGSFFCSYLSPALFNALAENHVAELMTMALYILFAMAFGFVFFRLMGKLYQHTA